jgi:hypothetical protein
MGMMKDIHIDHLNQMDSVAVRDLKQHDFRVGGDAKVEVEEIFTEDFGWAGDTCWTGE